MTHYCAGCDQPVHALGESEAPGRFWHGDCWIEYVRGELGEPYSTLNIGSYSHDERVADGLELP